MPRYTYILYCIYLYVAVLYALRWLRARICRWTWPGWVGSEARARLDGVRGLCLRASCWGWVGRCKGVSCHCAFAFPRDEIACDSADTVGRHGASLSAREPGRVMCPGPLFLSCSLPPFNFLSLCPWHVRHRVP